MPEGDIRGLYEHAQDILLHGRVMKYEEEKDEPIDPAYIDMLSEGRTDSQDLEDSAQKTKVKQRKIVDKWYKWQMLEDDRAKHRAPQPERVKIDPNVPNLDLIEKMMQEKRRRN